MLEAHWWLQESKFKSYRSESLKRSLEERNIDRRLPLRSTNHHENHFTNPCVAFVPREVVHRKFDAGAGLDEHVPAVRVHKNLDGGRDDVIDEDQLGGSLSVHYHDATNAGDDRRCDEMDQDVRHQTCGHFVAQADDFVVIVDNFAQLNEQPIVLFRRERFERFVRLCVGVKLFKT